jgi:hypothetical protein
MKKEKQNFRSYCFCNAVAPVLLSEGKSLEPSGIFARANNFARARLSFRSSQLFAEHETDSTANKKSDYAQDAL